MKMVPYEAFACRCRTGDVVLRESYKPKTRGKLYYACPLSKPRKIALDVDFLWKEEQVRLLTSSFGAPSTPKCSNCKHLLDKIKVLKATVEMYMHLKQHTVNSDALLHEVYNDMEKLDLE
ncbi:hypothetical protein Tco_0323739 [Tanacetum coccineum]